MKKVFIGTHIPKTAGSTLIGVLEKEFGYGRFHQTTSLMKNANLEIPFIEEVINTDKFDVVFGHHVDEKILLHFLNRDIYLFTFIREPVQRIISQYYFSNQLRKDQNHKLVDFKDFYNRIPKNFMCHFIIKRFSLFLGNGDNSLSLHKKAIRVLQSFKFVCHTEEFDSMIIHLLEDMKINSKNVAFLRKNTTNYKEFEDRFDLDRIKSENKEDLLLYDFFCNARKENLYSRNPLGFNLDYYQQSLSKLANKPYAQTQRLRYCFSKAAQEYQDYGKLEREVAKSRQKLLNEALKFEVLFSKSRGELNDRELGVVAELKRVLKEIDSSEYL